jgi:DNA-binding NarL/FixJ family response regulator
MENRHRARIVIADDHKLVAEACKKLLEPEFEVVGTVSDGLALLQAVSELRPNVVILDISMPLLNGLDAGEQIKQKNRATKLIYLTMMVGPDIAAEAFRRGASGYVLKHCNAEELAVAVRRALRGESYLSPTITRDTVEFLLRSGAVYKEQKHISRRQSEVLKLLAEGKTMKEIAYILNVSHGTVAFHKYRLMHALGIKSSTGLIEYAIKNHIVSETTRLSLTTTNS